MKLDPHQIETASVPLLIEMAQDLIMGGRTDGFDPINDGAQRDALVSRFVAQKCGVRVVQTPNRSEVFAWSLEQQGHPRGYGIRWDWEKRTLPVELVRAMLVILAGGGEHYER